MSASNYLESAALNHFFRGVATPPPGCFLHLYISNPTEADIGVEVSGASYVPQPITFTAPEQVTTNTPSGQVNKTIISNNTEIRFTNITENWGLITHFGIRDAADGGNLLAYAPTATPREILEGDESIWSVGSISISMD